MGIVKSKDCWVTLRRYKIGYPTRKAEVWKLGLRKVHKGQYGFSIIE